MATKQKVTKSTVEVNQIDFRTVTLEYEGISPLICNNPDAKFGDDYKHVGGPKGKVYDLDKEFVDSLYFLNGKHPAQHSLPLPTCGVPARWFRKASIHAVSFLGWSKQHFGAKHVQGMVFVLGDVVPLIYNPKKDPQKYITTVVRPPRTGSRVKVCRAIFENWGVKIQVRYNAGLITPDHIFNLFQMAGTVSGFGDDRPAKGGTHGMSQLKGLPTGF